MSRLIAAFIEINYKPSSLASFGTKNSTLEPIFDQFRRYYTAVISTRRYFFRQGFLLAVILFWQWFFSQVFFSQESFWQWFFLQGFLSQGFLWQVFRLSVLYLRLLILIKYEGHFPKRIKKSTTYPKHRQIHFLPGSLIFIFLFLLHSILPSHFSSFSTPGGNTCLMFASQLQTLKCCLHTKLFFKMWTVKVVGGNQDWFMTGTSTQLRRGFFFFCNRCTFGLNPTQSRMSSRNETAVTKVAPFRGAGDACDQHRTQITNWVTGTTPKHILKS